MNSQNEENLNLQDQYAPQSICFGCGPANEKGLQIKSIPNEETSEVKAFWRPQSHHEAFPGMLNGGIIGALLDCHSNWTSAWVLMRKNEESHPPCTVTASYQIKLNRPTPTDQELVLSAHPTNIEGDRVEVEASLSANGKICATCKGTFVAVKPGHPAYHRW